MISIFIAFKLYSKTSKFGYLIGYLKKVINFGLTEVTYKLIEVNDNLISHIGTIKSINNRHFIVKIISQTACSSCQAKGSCHSSEQVEKEIEVEQKEGVFTIGEEVLITTTSNQGYKALVFAYLIPLILLVSMLTFVLIATKKEALAALAALSLVVLYYWLLFIYRDQLKKSFSFKLLKLPNISQYE